jgi:hypothetical protein
MITIAKLGFLGPLFGCGGMNAYKYILIHSKVNTPEGYPFPLSLLDAIASVLAFFASPRTWTVDGCDFQMPSAFYR